MKKPSICEEDANLLMQYDLQEISLNKAVRLSFEPGEYLIRAGEPIDYLYFVVSGKAKVCLSVSNGKQLLLCYFMSRGIIGDVELMTGQRTAFTTMRAVTRFTCIGLPLSVYSEILRSNTRFVNRIGRELAKKLMQSDINGAITILHPLEARLCAYIQQTSTNGVFRETLTDVAELIGTSYRHLLRCLDKLCRDGVLLKQSFGYVVANQQEFEKRAGDLYMT